MPPIRSSVSERRTYIVAVILLLSKVILTYSCCVLKGLIYIIIMALSSRQLFLYAKYTKLNMRSSCDIKSVSNTKCICFKRLWVLQSL